MACALVEAGCGDAIVDAITASALLRPGMHLRRLEPALRVPISIMMRNQDPMSALHRDLIERLRAACDTPSWRASRPDRGRRHRDARTGRNENGRPRAPVQTGPARPVPASTVSPA